MQGFSDKLECYALGKGSQLVQLKIPLVGSHCGINEATSEVNRYVFFFNKL